MARMHSITMGGVLLVTLLMAGMPADAPAAPPKPPTPPRDAPKDFLDVQEWWGNYVITVTADEAASGDREGLYPWSHASHTRQRSEGSFHLNKAGRGGVMPGHFNDQPDIAALADKHRLRTWYGLFGAKDVPTAFVAYDESYEGTHDDPVEGRVVDKFGTESHSHGAGYVKVYQQVMLTIDLKKKLYGLVFPYDTINTRDVKVTTTTLDWTQWFDGRYSDSTRTETRGGVISNPTIPQDAHHKPEWIVDQPLPDQIGKLKGSVTYHVPINHGKKNVAHVEIRWFLSPEPPEDLELILAPADDGQYNAWRPKGSLSEDKPGAKLTVAAKLQKKGGGTPKETASSITFKLEQVSHEPGICINYPKSWLCKDQPDLKFLLKDNPRSRGLTVPDDQRVVRLPRNGEKLTIADATVSSFDYGAFGLVEAKCELESGRELTAHLKGDEGRYSLRLPRSREGSHIADCWREKYGAQGDDRADDDNYPVGDGHKGDGFTLFEEYRGFVDQRKWSDLSPGTKDFFVVNMIGGDLVDGVFLLEDVSHLKVHEVRPEAVDAHRVVNFNRSSWASRVQQHAVIVVQGANKEYSEAVGGSADFEALGTPKDFDFVAMQDIGDRPMDAATVAHELLHTCNVYHHGDDDIWHAKWITEYDWQHKIRIYPATVGDDGTATQVDGASRIKLFLESDPEHEIEPPAFMQLAPVVTVYIGVPHGQHSGAETCVMRYGVAAAYPKGPPNEYFWVKGEERTTVFNTLCTGPEGFSINRAGRKPQPRYDEADTAAQRGKCAFQILVNDAVPAPSRLGGKPTKPAGG